MIPLPVLRLHEAYIQIAKEDAGKSSVGIVFKWYNRITTPVPHL